MCFVSNLDAHLFAFCHFSWRKTKQRKRPKKKGKKEMEDWQSSGKVFWTEGKVCNWGPWRESSLYVKKNYSWRFCFVRGLWLFSKHQVIFFFLNFKHDWTPSTNCTNTTSSVESCFFKYCFNLSWMNAAFAFTPECLRPCLFESSESATSGL